MGGGEGGRKEGGTGSTPGFYLPVYCHCCRNNPFSFPCRHLPVFIPRLSTTTRADVLDKFPSLNGSLYRDWNKQTNKQTNRTNQNKTDAWKMDEIERAVYLHLGMQIERGMKKLETGLAGFDSLRPRGRVNTFRLAPHFRRNWSNAMRKNDNYNAATWDGWISNSNWMIKFPESPPPLSGTRLEAKPIQLQKSPPGDTTAVWRCKPAQTNGGASNDLPHSIEHTEPSVKVKTCTSDADE